MEWGANMSSEVYELQKKYAETILKFDDIDTAVEKELKERASIAQRLPEVTIRLHGGEFFVNYHIDSNNFGCNAGTVDLEQILRQVTEGIKAIRELRPVGGETK